MSESWPELEQLKQLLVTGYRPRDELLKLIERVATEGDLAVDRVEIDHDARLIWLAWETGPLFERTGGRA